MTRIFISYSRKDREHAQRLAAGLDALGHQVWWDHKLEAGDDFGREIENALGKVSVVLVVWTEHSIESKWVRAEASRAMEEGMLIPLRLRPGVKPPMPFNLIDAFDLGSWDGNAFAPAFQDLQKKIFQVETGHWVEAIADLAGDRRNHPEKPVAMANEHRRRAIRQLLMHNSTILGLPTNRFGVGVLASAAFVTALVYVVGLVITLSAPFQSTDGSEPLFDLWRTAGFTAIGIASARVCAQAVLAMKGETQLFFLSRPFVYWMAVFALFGVSIAMIFMDFTNVGAVAAVEKGVYASISGLFVFFLVRVLVTASTRLAEKIQD